MKPLAQATRSSFSFFIFCLNAFREPCFCKLINRQPTQINFRLHFTECNCHCCRSTALRCGYKRRTCNNLNALSKKEQKCHEEDGTRMHSHHDMHPITPTFIILPHAVATATLTPAQSAAALAVSFDRRDCISCTAST